MIESSAILSTISRLNEYSGYTGLRLVYSFSEKTIILKKRIFKQAGRAIITSVIS